MSDTKRNILIIDDDDRNIFALTATLKAKGFSCVSCIDAHKGLEILQGSTPIDAVLLDMMMPDMDGYEAIPRIRAMDHRRRVPVFAVTAQAMPGDREKCLEAGANDYISKPIDVDRLLFLLSTSIV
ncbi:MAG: response regulator receiver protein [Chitinophagaceae bacterium]|nr:response regulator receiver protein [Chitinophagaceae bacterium]